MLQVLKWRWEESERAYTSLQRMSDDKYHEVRFAFLIMYIVLCMYTSCKHLTKLQPTYVNDVDRISMNIIMCLSPPLRRKLCT
jgi:hypothetical protein